MEMGLVDRELPFGDPICGAKRTLYRIRDPFLRFWFRFVEPNRSVLESRGTDAVEEYVATEMAHHVASALEDLARRSVQGVERAGRRWGSARRWWGAGTDRRPMEVDLVAEEDAGEALLVEEVKWSSPRRGRGLLAALERKAERLPFAAGRELVPVLWLRSKPADLPTDRVFAQVLDVLRRAPQGAAGWVASVNLNRGYWVEGMRIPLRSQFGSESFQCQGHKSTPCVS
jgi:AAA+ ATPase superfamily predicted ATPase